MINDNNPPYYNSMHPQIANQFLDFHVNWLPTVPPINGYKSANFNQIKDLLKQNSFMSAATQFYALFPAHYFKVVYTFENIIGQSQILDWLRYNSKVCVVDIGCGAGSASIAFIEMVLRLKEDAKLPQPVDLHFVGVDLNRFSTILYARYLNLLKDQLLDNGINISFNLIPYGAPGAIPRLIHFLSRTREKWGQPFLPHIFVLQVNVVSPLSDSFEILSQRYEDLKGWGIDDDVLGDYHSDFGQAEALAYKQLFEQVPVDHMHVITVGTGQWEGRVQEMANALNVVFNGSQHMVERFGEGTYRVYYENPQGGYWRDRNLERHNSAFHVDVSSIYNASLDDDDWNKVLNDENLLLAWARARHHLLGESLVDEVELRIFEANLDENLSRVKQQLIVYTEDVVSKEILSYKFPKNLANTRPRGLSRFEEEILATAIIQQLGSKAGLSTRSFAYRFERNLRGQNEYFYEYWFVAYQKYLKRIQDEVQKYESCSIIRTDIKSFYTRIIRDQLYRITSERLSESPRIRWLLKALFSKELDEHELGKGIVQGNLESGFYANLYLASLDNRFVPNNEWNAEFFRYVDDMVIVVPNPDDVPEVLNALNLELNELGLELNIDKTETFNNTSDFLDTIAQDEILEQISEEFDQVLNAIWITNSDYRQIFRRAYFETGEQWWYQINLYKHCLKSIGIFVTVQILSRRIYKYLFDQTKVERDLKRDDELLLPSLPSESDSEHFEVWSGRFVSENVNWIEDRNQLIITLVRLFLDSWTALQSEPLDTGDEKRYSRRLRFAINRLAQLGFAGVENELQTILCNRAWLVNEPARTIESVANQGLMELIFGLLECYSDQTSIEENPVSEYMRAVILRAIRYLPELNLEQWETVVQYAVSDSILDCLMASETWLYLRRKCQHLITARHLEAVKLALEKVPPPIDRLRKNYRLILGNYEDERVPVDTTDAFIVQDADNLALEGFDVFAYEEPEVIRKSYYSGTRSDEPGEEESST